MHRRQGWPHLDPAAVVLVVEGGRDISHYEDAGAAAAHMEAIDVEAGDYTAVYGLDGTVFELSLKDGKPWLHRTDRKEAAALQRTLREYHDEPPDSALTYDTHALIDEWQMRRWEHRWPRWPTWLDERIHGTGPALLHQTPPVEDSR